MKRLWSLFAFLPFFLISQSGNKYPSLLWKITGNGLKQPSYLYGTMHVSNRVAWYLSEQFFEALNEVQVVGLETNPGEWLENMEKTGELEELNQIRNPNSFGNDFYKNTFAPSLPEKRMLQGILSYDPDIINGLLYRQNRSKENFEENTYIDLFIYQSASKLNKKVISLENFAQSEIKARLSSIPDEDPAPSGSALKYFDHVTKIEDAYREGNLDKLDSLSKLSSSKNAQKYLINDRNVFFVRTIDSVLKSHTLFSGVGAAHLPGSEGVIELLRQKGYTLQPVVPKVSRKSNSFREKLDAMNKKVVFSKQYIPDSAFSMDLPGRLYPIVNLGTLRYFIYPDMVNGNFYTVVRLKHNAPVFGLSPSDLLLKVDSLLFENIPGKIVQKKEIVSNTGIRGIEIINTTRRGDHQHYRIYFTHTELIMFKIGGKQDYASSKEAEQFFSSIKFKNSSGPSLQFSPPAKGFSVNVPPLHNYTNYGGTALTGPVEDLFAHNAVKKQSYGVQRAVYNDFTYLEVDSFELVKFTRNTLFGYGFNEGIKYTLGSTQQFPSVQFHANNTGGAYMDGKIIIKGVHYYFVFQISEKGSAPDFAFLDSFRLGDFEYLNPMKKIKDRDFCFEVKDEVSDNALSRFNEAYASAYAMAKKKTEVPKNDFAFRTGDKYYYSPSSREYVKIVFEKYNDYDYRNPKELQKKIDKTFSESGTMFITSRTLTSDSNSLNYRFSLRDTATARAIKVHLYFRNGTMHELSAPYDTILGLKGWTREFMESFSPLDSVVGRNIFENKFSQLLNDLSGSDTSARRRADQSVSSIALQKEYTDDLIQFISGKSFHKVNEESRAQLLVNGGTLNSEKIIEPYINLYKHYSDSFYLQLCILKGLSYLHTEKSYAAIRDLLLKEPPLVGDEGTVKDIFAALYDSLELCRKFYPDLLTLTRYDEYKNSVYSLLAELMHNNLIAPALCKANCSDILNQANLEIKRYNSSGSKQIGSSEQHNFDHLEKNSKELAETIRGNLEGLANNNLYKGSPYLQNLVTQNRSSLVNYALILSPFYKTDPAVSLYFERLSKIKSQTILMPVCIDLIKRNIFLNDTLVSFFSENRFTRTFFYSELEKEGLTKHFDKRFLSQESLIESLLLSQKQLNTYYASEKETKSKDSLILMSVLPAKNIYQEGKMYVYKLAKTKGEEEVWTAVFVQNSDNTISSRIEVVSTAFYRDPQKTNKENLDVLTEQFAMSFRKRADVSGSARE